MIYSIANRIILNVYNKLVPTAVIIIMIIILYSTRPRKKEARILFCLTSSFYTSSNDEWMNK